MGYRKNIVAYAEKQIGSCEPGGDDKYIQIYNRLAGTSLPMTAPWCCCFTTACLRECNVPTSVFGNFAQCSVAVSQAKKKGIWHARSSGYTPRPGDFVLFDWDSNGAANHIGIVKEATSSLLTTIEGNTSSPYGGTDGVYEKSHVPTASYIFGYIAIPYGDDEDDTEDRKDIIKSVQQMLNQRFKAGLTVDGLAGPKTKKAVIVATQRVLNMSYGAKLIIDGIWGSKSKASFPEIALGAKGNLVRVIQCALVIHGADIKIDGDFGKDTKAAVLAYQEANKLSSDGIVGKLTMTALLK